MTVKQLIDYFLDWIVLHKLDNVKTCLITTASVDFDLHSLLLGVISAHHVRFLNFNRKETYLTFCNLFVAGKYKCNFLC